MLKVDLIRLARTGRELLTSDISPSDPLWEGAGIPFRDPLRVEAEVRPLAGGGVHVSATLSTRVALECRRCLEEVVVVFREPVRLVYEPRGPGEPEDEWADTYPLEMGGRELDLREAVREQFLLAVPRYVVCRPECRGLCPRCGANLNVEACRCRREAADPRWAPLRALIEGK